MRLAVGLAVTVLSLAALAGATAQAQAGGLNFLTAWGTQGIGDGQFQLPDGIAVDNAGTVWVADRNANRVQRFDPNGRPLPFSVFARRHTSAAPGRFNLPYSAAVDPVGDIYVADTHNHRIQEFGPDGSLVRMWGSHGTGPGQLDQPRDLALDPYGNLWVADHENHRVVKFGADGRFLGQFGANGGDGSLGLGDGEFNSPRGLSSDPAGNIYVADDANQRIVKLDNAGRFLAKWGTNGGNGGPPGSGAGDLSLPYSTAIDAAGHVWVTDTNNNRVVEFTGDGRFVANYGAHGGDGTPGEGPGEFNHPYDVAIDCVGNVYVTDKDNFRVQKFGDPSAGPPSCPPHAQVGAPTGRASTALTVPVTCDRLCAVVATATVRPPRGRSFVLRSARTILPAGATTPVSMTAARRRPRLKAGRLGAALVVTASGAPGASTSVSRRVSLRP